MTKPEKTGRIIGVLEIFTTGIWTISFILIIIGLLIGQGLHYVKFFIFIFSYLFFSVLLAMFGVISTVTKRSIAPVMSILLLSISVIEHAFIIDHIVRSFTRYSTIHLSISIIEIISALAGIIFIAYYLSEPKQPSLNIGETTL